MGGFKHDESSGAFSQAIVDEAASDLAAMVAYYRSRAAYFEGRCEGMKETVEYLKERVKALELAVDEYRTLNG